VNRIPKVIHYCWFGSSDLPPLYKSCVQSWNRVLPDFEIRLWNERNFKSNSKFFNDMIRSSNWAFASDYARLSVLKEYGGIYLDADVEVIRDLSPLLEDGGCFIGYESPGRLTTGVIGSERDHPFLTTCMEIMDDRHLRRKAYLIAPEVATLAAEKQPASENMRFLSEPHFYPYNPYDKSRSIDTLLFSDIKDCTYAIHHWGKSWKQSLHHRILKKIQKLVT